MDEGFQDVGPCAIAERVNERVEERVEREKDCDGLRVG